MIPRHNLTHPARLAVVEQYEVLDDIEQPLLREHAVKQNFCVQLALASFIVALPLAEVLPLARNRAVPRAVAVAYYQKRIVMEGLCDAVFMQVISQIVVEASADVQINGFELDENQRQTVNEADKIGPPVVMRHAHTLNLQLAYREESVIGRIAKVDHSCAHELRLPCFSSS